MPSSPLLTVNAVVGTVRRLRPRRVLDIGVGSGKWGFLLREQTDLEVGRDRSEWTITIDGVEGFPDYIGDHQRAVYDSIYIGDAIDWLSAYRAERYDVALAMDIIEHFEPEGAVVLVREALRCADVLFVTTPKRFYRQHDERNPLQSHLSWWPRAAFAQLADQVEARVSVTQTVTTNIAVLSRSIPPRVPTDAFLAAASALRDRLFPELLYYRLRHRTGPMLAKGLRH